MNAFSALAVILFFVFSSCHPKSDSSHLSETVTASEAKSAALAALTRMAVSSQQDRVIKMPKRRSQSTGTHIDDIVLKSDSIVIKNMNFYRVGEDLSQIEFSVQFLQIPINANYEHWVSFFNNNKRLLSVSASAQPTFTVQMALAFTSVVHSDGTVSVVPAALSNIDADKKVAEFNGKEGAMVRRINVDEIPVRNDHDNKISEALKNALNDKLNDAKLLAEMEDSMNKQLVSMSQKDKLKVSKFPYVYMVKVLLR